VFKVGKRAQRVKMGPGVCNLVNQWEIFAVAHHEISFRPHRFQVQHAQALLTAQVRNYPQNLAATCIDLFGKLTSPKLVSTPGLTHI